MKGKRKSLLQGIFVLDLADEQGSFCTKILADLGATVVKIEPPQGDPARWSGPFYSMESGPAKISLPFFYHNMNKLGIVLDLESRKGKHYLHKLIEGADVLVETLPDSSMKLLDLGRAQSNRINSRLIHISITGFGRTGPRCSYLSSDSVASAYGGQMHLTGTPTGPPVELFGPQSWYAASLYGANAVLLSLKRRRITGKGCYVDLSIQESVASTLDRVMIDYFHNGEIAGRKQRDSSSDAFNLLPCKDGHIQIPILRNWKTLIQLMESDGKAQNLLEKKWRSETYRIKHLKQITDAVAEWTESHTRHELFELGQAMQFPWAPICTLRDVIVSPQLGVRRFFIHARIPGSGWLNSIPGLPYKFSSYIPNVPMPAPRLGQHTKQVLEQLGCAQKSEADIPQEKRKPPHPIKSGRILDGIRVVDFTRMLSGPYTTRILSDFGAEVIKIQSRSTAQGAERNGTPYFANWNRNKRSICLNLDRPEARDLILELIARSDIVVENFSPRVMANWGLTYKRLRQIKPDLIMASISAMGHTGKWKNYVGYAHTFHALSGLIAQSSQTSKAPIEIINPYGDVIAGLYSAIAILASLENKDRTGKGQYIDISAYEAMCTLLGPSLMEDHFVLEENGSSKEIDDHGADALYRCYPCAGDDKWCVINIANETEWQSLCRVLNKSELMSDKFSTDARRKKHRSELDKVIAEWTIRRSPKTIVRRLQREGIAAGIVQNAEDLARDTQLASRRFWVSMEHPALESTRSDRSALWPWREKPADWKAAPRLGEDNRYVFVELLGKSEADFQSLIKKGIIQ